MTQPTKMHRKHYEQYVWKGPDYKVQLDVQQEGAWFVVHYLPIEAAPNMRYAAGGLSYSGPDLKRAHHYVKKRVPGAELPKKLKEVLS